MWGYGPMMGYGWRGMGWMMAANGVFWLAVLVLVAVLAYRLVRSGEHARHPGRSAGLDLLDERYARGEIDREDYLRRKQDLTDRGAPPPKA